VAAKRGGAVVASDLGQSRHGIDGVLALHLVQQVLAVGSHAGVVVLARQGQQTAPFAPWRRCEALRWPRRRRERAIISTRAAAGAALMEGITRG
jgi:hypothetical protein